MLVVHPVPAFKDNYLWLFHAAGDNQAWVVDPGDDAPVRAALAERGLTLAGILITHHHPDHIGGLDALLREHPAPVYGPHTTDIPQVDHPVAEGDQVHCAGVPFRVFEVPGHTLDHIAFYAEPADEPPLLFCGDTLFAGGCGRLFEGTPEQMHHSLEKLARLPLETRVYCAHEYTLANLAFARKVEPDNPLLRQRVTDSEALRAREEPTVPSTLAMELATNPFLRCDEPSVQSAAEEHSGTPLAHPTAVFAAVRRWKDAS